MLSLNNNLFDTFKFYSDYEKLSQSLSWFIEKKEYISDEVTCLYINTSGDAEHREDVERYENNIPCKRPVKIGLFTWDRKKYPGLDGIYTHYDIKRGRNTGYGEHMKTVMFYPFNRKIRQHIDQWIIKFIVSLHRDMNQDIECSFDYNPTILDITYQRCGLEFIQHGVTQKYVQFALMMTAMIENCLMSNELYSIMMSHYSEKTKEYMDRIKSILTTIDTEKTEEDYIYDDETISVSSSLLDDKIQHSTVIDYIPENWDINHETLIYSFDRRMTSKTIEKIAYNGYVSNVTIVELTDLSNEEKPDRIIKNINIIYKNDIFLQEMKNEITGFNCIIANPPYDGDKYKKFLVSSYKMLPEDGKMMFICPAAFLNDQRYEKSDRNLRLRKMIEPHVVKIIMENLNVDFNTRNNHPFAIIFIDKKKKGKKIEFICNGETFEVKDINDCNLNGKSSVQMDIQRKMLNYKITGYERNIHKPYISKSDTSEKADLIREQYDEKFNSLKDYYFVAFNCILSSITSNEVMNTPKYKISGLFYSYTECYVHHNLQRVLTFKEADEYRKSGKYNYFFYGTKEEMENWIYNSMNLKLLKAFSIIRFWDQNNQVYSSIPFLCEKKYTDEEVYSIFNINDKEKEYIDELLEKYDMDSPWFQRYISGEPLKQTNLLDGIC